MKKEEYVTNDRLQTTTRLPASISIHSDTRTQALICDLNPGMLSPAPTPHV